MMLAGSPGSAQIIMVMIAGTRNGSSNAAVVRTIGLNHQCLTTAPHPADVLGDLEPAPSFANYSSYLQESISVK